jgi:hypothetical protein
MTIKKAGRRLVKLGKKASKALGKGGRKWVEAVFETASGILEAEMEDRKSAARKKPATRRTKQVTRQGPVGPPALAGKTARKVEKKRRRRPAKATRNLDQTGAAEPGALASAATATPADELEGQPTQRH